MYFHYLFDELDLRLLGLVKAHKARPLMSMSTSIYTGPEGLVLCGLILITKGNMASEQVRVRVTIFFP
jgi:hypothetical protein